MKKRWPLVLRPKRPVRDGQDGIAVIAKCHGQSVAAEVSRLTCCGPSVAAEAGC